MSWLDRNAFGSVRHSLILFVLRHFGFPEHFNHLLHTYYDHLSVIVDILAYLPPGLSTLRLGFSKAAPFHRFFSTSSFSWHSMSWRSTKVSVTLSPVTKKHLCYPQPMLLISNWSQASLSRINVCWTLSRSSFSGPALWKPVQQMLVDGVKNLCRWLPSFRPATHHLRGTS